MCIHVCDLNRVAQILLMIMGILFFSMKYTIVVILTLLHSKTCVFSEMSVLYYTNVVIICNSTVYKTNWSNLVAVMDWGGANSRFLGLVSVWAARSFDQTALRPSVIKRIRQIDVKIHITSFGVTA